MCGCVTNFELAATQLKSMKRTGNVNTLIENNMLIKWSQIAKHKYCNISIKKKKQKTLSHNSNEIINLIQYNLNLRTHKILFNNNLQTLNKFC